MRFKNKLDKQSRIVYTYANQRLLPGYGMQGVYEGLWAPSEILGGLEVGYNKDNTNRIHTRPI